MLWLVNVPLLLLHLLMRALAIANVWLSYCGVHATKRVGLMMHLLIVSACVHAHLWVYLR